MRKAPSSTAPMSFSLELYAAPDSAILSNMWGRTSPFSFAPIPNGEENRIGLILHHRFSLSSGEVCINKEHILVLHFHATKSWGAKLQVWWCPTVPTTLKPSELMRFRLYGKLTGSERIFKIDLGCFADQIGRIKLICKRGECLITTFRIHPVLMKGRVNAFTDYDQRLTNEVNNFSGNAYTHPMYGDLEIDKDEDKKLTKIAIHKGEQSSQKIFLAQQKECGEQILHKLHPVDGEVTYNFAMRCLGQLISTLSPPDFFLRAKERSQICPQRILSICTGAARVEEAILQHCEGGVHMTLLDASLDLIERAAKRLLKVGKQHNVDCLNGDINQGLPGEDQYDVILCVSALHHIVDLERVLTEINARLTNDGEFWIIGEQIGRNGNRLWPDALEAANIAMQNLPERFRLNGHTKEIDCVIDDRDYSLGCFEGIRSEEIEAYLDRYLVAQQVYKRNAFLWRMVDATYGDNFNLESIEDVEYLKKLVLAEVLHWVGGGRSTELHGVYTKKYIRS